ncbi:MAG: DUF3857 domain-containing protein [Bacteroidia bacterium]
MEKTVLAWYFFMTRTRLLKSLKGEVYSGVGKLYGKFTQRDFLDESAVSDFSLYEDSRIKRYSPNMSNFPYTIVYQYEILFKQNLIIPSWSPKPGNDVSVEKSSYTFVCKPNDKLRIKTQNLSEPVTETITDKQKTQRWTANHIIAVKAEPFSPNLQTYEPFVKIAPEDFSYYKYESSYKDWQELGKWIYDDLLKDRTALPLPTVQMMKDLVKLEKTDGEKVRKIYQYLQDKTRYISVQIGIGGFKPFSAADVDRLGYGDCKALVNYMQSLLKAVDIDSYYCIVNAGDEKKGLDPSFASMNQANHVILCVPLAGDTTWLECTSQKMPYGFLSTFTDDRIVLACTPDGGKLLRTPKYSPEQNFKKRRAQLFLDKDGNISGEVATSFQGTQYDNHEHIAGKILSEQQKLLKQVYPVDNINFSKVNYIERKDKLPELEENLTLTIRNYAAVSAKRIFLTVNPFPSKKNAEEVRYRTLPVHINRGYSDEENIYISLAEDINPLMEPVEKSYENQFGSYFAKTSIKGNVITYYRKFKLNQGTFNASSYADFVKFINDVNAADQLRYALTLK